MRVGLRVVDMKKKRSEGGQWAMVQISTTTVIVEDL